MMKIATTVLSCLLLTAPALAEDAPSGIKRTPLQSIDFPDGYKTMSGLAEILPGHASGPHTHPGIEMGYLLEGEVVMSVEGEPERTLKAGDSFVIPSGAIHDVKSTGSMPTRAVSVFVVDKTKPFVTPAK